jgi:hypothetical protein
MSRMNWTHSGGMFRAAGFLWLIAAVIVLVTDAPISPWGAGMIVVMIPLVIGGQVRQRRREPRIRPRQLRQHRSRAVAGGRV